jgi:thioredoxin 2
MPVTDDPIIVPCPHCDALNRVPRAKLADRGRCGECHQPLFTGHPLALGKERFERHLDKGDLPLLIDFWASWCGPCRVMAPEFERAAAELEPEMRLVKINVDEEPELARRFAVQSIPTIALARRGRELDRKSGAMPAAQLVRWARAHAV